MRHCSAFNCTNNDHKCPGKSFFLFPMKNPALLKAWLVKVKRENFQPSSSSSLCMDHFTADCIRFENFTQRRLLKPGSIPTIFSHVPVHVPRRVINRVPSQVNPTPLPNLPSTSSGTSRVLPSTATQTEVSFVALIDALADATKTNSVLKELLAGQSFQPDNIKTDDQMRALTGFTKQKFEMIFSFLKLQEELSDTDRDTKLTPKLKYFLFMVKLRTGISNEFLSVLFDISDSTVSRYFTFVSNVVYLKFKLLDIWPSKDQVKKNMSRRFLDRSYSLRVIIDCLEIKLQKPTDPNAQQLTFSYYKNANTAKAIVGLCPSGEISFISNLYCGSISDKEIFLKSGLLSRLEAGDLVMADKGFKILEDLKKINCSLDTPCFLKDKIQFTLTEREQNYRVANLRVHVERVISRIKVFKYFDGAIPYGSFHNLNELFFIASMLTNFQDNLIRF